MHAHLRNDELFTERFNALVWSDLVEPLEFEKKWEDIITDFGLTDDSWFKSMYGGLYRTTSPSVSVNNFYNGYLNRNSNLLAFFMQFESALDSQRHANERLNSADKSRMPQLSTPFLFEKHAATVYTTSVFLKVQKEIEAACYVCFADKIYDHESIRDYYVNDSEKGVFKIVHNKADNSVTCSCKKFVRVGLLCLHIFVILKDLKLAAIPNMFVVSRWTKSARLKPIYIIDGGFEEQLVVMEEFKLEIQTIKVQES